MESLFAFFQFLYDYLMSNIYANLKLYVADINAWHNNVFQYFL